MSQIVYLKTACERCSGHIEYPCELAGQSIECPHCHQATPLPPPLPAAEPASLSLMEPTRARLDGVGRGSIALKSLIKTVESIAMVIALSALVILVATILFQGIFGLVEALASIDLILLIIAAASVVWCVFRWKELDKRS